jgi:hypothetical protein
VFVCDEKSREKNYSFGPLPLGDLINAETKSSIRFSDRLFDPPRKPVPICHRFPRPPAHINQGFTRRATFSPRPTRAAGNSLERVLKDELDKLTLEIPFPQKPMQALVNVLRLREQTPL